MTLIEILVVISIIGLLIGIGAVVANRFIVEARKEQVRASLKGMVGAATEFKSVRKAELNHDGIYPIDWRSEGSALSSSQRFVKACRQIPGAEAQMLAALNADGTGSAKDTFRDLLNNDGVPDTIFDRWDTEIEFRSSNAGSKATGQGPTRSDGTRINNNLLPASKSPFFVSAGPDQEFGTDDDISSLDN